MGTNVTSRSHARVVVLRQLTELNRWVTFGGNRSASWVVYSGACHGQCSTTHIKFPLCRQYTWSVFGHVTVGGTREERNWMEQLFYIDFDLASAARMREQWSHDACRFQFVFRRAPISVKRSRAGNTPRNTRRSGARMSVRCQPPFRKKIRR